MKNYLTPAELQSALALRDSARPIPPSAPTRCHCCWQTSQWRWNASGASGAETHRISSLVSTADNYDRLGYSPDDVTRDSRYSRHVSPTVMLRSHTSAGVPALLDALRQDMGRYDRLHALPGPAYRRDSIDRTHVGAPHQVDLWRVKARGLLGPAALHGDDGRRRGGGPSRRTAPWTWSGAQPPQPTATRTRAGSWTCSSPSRTARGNGWNWPNAASSPRRFSAAPGWIRAAGPASPWDWGWTVP